MSKFKIGGLDQYDAEPFEQQQFGTAGIEGANDDPATCRVTLFIMCNAFCTKSNRRSV